MPKPLVIEIPVMVGSNGAWCANGYPTTGDHDWGLMADCLEKEGKYPVAERHYMVRATVFIPDEEPEVVLAHGATIAEDAPA